MSILLSLDKHHDRHGLVAANQNHQHDISLRTLEQALEFFLNRHDPAISIQLMLYERNLMVHESRILERDAVNDPDGILALERAGSLVMLYSWIYQQEVARKMDTFVRPVFRNHVLRLCESKLPRAYELLDKVPHCYADLLLSKAILQRNDQERFRLVREAGAVLADVTNADMLALLRSRIALIHRYCNSPFTFIGWARYQYWRIRAVNTPGVSEKYRDGISQNFDLSVQL